jgi:hypothetical protein
MCRASEDWTCAFKILPWGTVNLRSLAAMQSDVRVENVSATSLISAVLAALMVGYFLEHDPEKWVPVFRKDHAPPIS